jgi:hypothetical protein
MSEFYKLDDSLVVIKDEHLDALLTTWTTLPASAVKQVDTSTITGTSGTATVTLAWWLTNTLTFDTDLTTTNSNFVTANADAYLVAWIVLTSSVATLIFTANVAWVAFTSPVITNVTEDLAWTNVNTTDNVAVDGYAKGCLFINTDVASGTSGLYVNEWLSTSCIFKLVSNA